MQPNWQSDRLKRTTTSGKYSGVTESSLPSREPSLAECGVESIILESQYNSAVSKYL